MGLLRKSDGNEVQLEWNAAPEAPEQWVEMRLVESFNLRSPKSISRADQQMEMILRRESLRTKNLWEEKKQKFKSIVDNIMPDAPLSDSVSQITMAAAEHNMALRAHTRALKEFDDFTIDGTIPSRLKRRRVKIFEQAR